MTQGKLSRVSSGFSWFALGGVIFLHLVGLCREARPRWRKTMGIRRLDVELLARFAIDSARERAVHS